jgi:hypothetical protein
MWIVLVDAFWTLTKSGMVEAVNSRLLRRLTENRTPETPAPQLVVWVESPDCAEQELPRKTSHTITILKNVLLHLNALT